MFGSVLQARTSFIYSINSNRFILLNGVVEYHRNTGQNEGTHAGWKYSACQGFKHFKIYLIVVFLMWKDPGEPLRNLTWTLGELAQKRHTAQDYVTATCFQVRAIYKDLKSCNNVCE